MTFDVHKAITTILEGKSDGERAKWQQFQEEQRAMFKPLDAVGQKMLYGVRAVALAEAALAHPLTEEQKDFEIKRLAEGLAYQGLLEEAIRVYSHPEYVAKLEAVTITGWCEHRKIDRFLKEVFVYNGQSYSLYTCPTCGFLNAE